MALLTIVPFSSSTSHVRHGSVALHKRVTSSMYGGLNSHCSSSATFYKLSCNAHHASKRAFISGELSSSSHSCMIQPALFHALQVPQHKQIRYSHLQAYPDILRWIYGKRLTSSSRQHPLGSHTSFPRHLHRHHRRHYSLMIFLTFSSGYGAFSRCDINALDSGNRFMIICSCGDDHTISLAELVIVGQIAIGFPVFLKLHITEY